MLHMSYQLSCNGLCKSVMWSDQQHELLQDLDYELINNFLNNLDTMVYVNTYTRAPVG